MSRPFRGKAWRNPCLTLSLSARVIILSRTSVMGRIRHRFEVSTIETGRGSVFFRRATAGRQFDDLPIPAWHLYNPAEYRHKISRLLARRPPVTMAEFSRGCVYKCDFCASKITMALGYRKKSPERCAEEVKAMHRLGWREFMLADDIFSSDNRWATAVCEAICRSGIKMAWSCTNGIRVESADRKLFDAMQSAGCYRVSFGFESGDDSVFKGLR